MARPSEQQQEALAGLLGLGSHSARKSHYPELLARLEELEAERNRYKWLFEHAVHGIFQASLGQGLRAANPALAQMLGYDDPQQVLWSLEDMAGQLFVGGEAEMRRIRALLRERGGLFGYETRLWRRDGSHIEVLMNLLLRHDEEELVEGFVADITERVQAQQRLQTMNEELERRVAERTHELEELNRQLRQARDAAEAANHSKDKYLAAASHDLLQPLNAARLLVDTLRERGLPAAELQLVERTHLALEGAETLLTDLLEIARLDQSAIRPDLDDYSLDELLAPLASEFEEVARAAGLALRARIPRLAVRTDARLLSRILRNLLSNACRYTERGSVLLGARRRGGKVRLEVWDTGRGIPADQLQAIFLEFNQLDAGRASERRGVGLGLAIVDRIAGILGYRIEVHSTPGRGSLFAIEVPLVRKPARPAPGEAIARVSAGDPLPGRRLLVVDNETEILFSMSALLGQWGCEVLTATDLEGARKALDGRAPDAILVDYHLDHGATGCQLLGALREDYGAEIAAVMITADRSDDCRRALARLGVPLLNKPLKPGKLRAALSALLGEAQGAPVAPEKVQVLAWPAAASVQRNGQGQPAERGQAGEEEHRAEAEQVGDEAHQRPGDAQRQVDEQRVGAQRSATVGSRHQVHRFHAERGEHQGEAEAGERRAGQADPGIRRAPQQQQAEAFDAEADDRHAEAAEPVDAIGEQQPGADEATAEGAQAEHCVGPATAGVVEGDEGGDGTEADRPQRQAHAVRGDPAEHMVERQSLAVHQRRRQLRPGQGEAERPEQDDGRAHAPQPQPLHQQHP